MASEIQVYNLAAKAAGQSTWITDPADDRRVARAIKAVWDIQRRAAIREGSWNFALERASLPALAATPAFGFAYAFQLPSDFLRLIEVRASWRPDYQIEGRNILTDQSGPLEIRYLKDVTEPALWSDDFADAFAKRLGFTVGPDIAGSSFDKGTAWNVYQDALRASKRVDAIENPPIAQEESEWVAARFVGSHEGPMRPGDWW